MSVADLLAEARTAVPDGVALREPETGRVVTWAELDDEVDRIAAGLGRLGLVAGYRVLLALTNRVEFVTAYLAVLRARLVAVPVNPRSATGEVVRIMADCGARAVFADSATVTMVRSAIAGIEDALAAADDDLARVTPVPQLVGVGVPVLGSEAAYASLLAERGSTGAFSTPDPESLAVLLYTSGTSGRPRAAMLSHRALLANIEQVARVEPLMIGPGDVIYGVLPLFHVYGLNAVLGVVLKQRATLVLASSFDVEGSLETIRDQGVTVVPVAPPVFAYWRGVDGLAGCLAGVRMLLSGSAPLAPEVVAEFAERTGKPIHQGYGLTEAAPVVTSTLCSATLKPGSVGAPLPGVEVCIVDDSGEATGTTEAQDDVGEIRVRGANLFSGYWPDGADGPDADGWYGTGDVGYLDDEGDLFLVDRLKELVIVSGFNVYPTEIEELIDTVPGVSENAVIGTPDPATGEAVVAYVVPEPGAVDIEAVVRERCLHELARFKQPKEIHVVPELPKTVTGKVAKGRLRAARRRANLGLLE
ncbi:MAG: AMP-binding protein [Nocardioidaceae bacterium]